MIRQSTVLVATPIAAELSQKNVDLSERVGPIVQGLNETTAAIVGFNMDNVAVDLPDYTGAVSEHTEVIGPVTDKLAEVIRGALYTISHFVKPICVRADELVKQQAGNTDPIDVVFGYLDVRQVNLEPEFLTSPFCPSEVPAALQEVPRVKLDLLLKGSYPQLSGDEVRDMVYVDIPTLYTFTDNPEELGRIYRQVFVENNWWELFDYKAIDQGIVDTASNDNVMNFNKFRPLVIANLIINRLCAMEGPLEGVTGVSLVEYRNSLELTRNVLTAILARFRNIWIQKAAAGVVILDEQVKYERAKYGVVEGMDVLTGSVSVGYNDAALTMFANDMDTSISELVIGQLYARQRGIVIRDVLTDFEILKENYKTYVELVYAKMCTQFNKIGQEAFTSAVQELSVTDKFEPLISALPGDRGPRVKLMDILSSRVELGHSFLNVEQIAEGKCSFMQTGLAIELAKIFQSEIAAEIIAASVHAKPGPVEHQRKELCGALVAAILKRLVK